MIVVPGRNKFALFANGPMMSKHPQRVFVVNLGYAQQHFYVLMLSLLVLYDILSDFMRRVGVLFGVNVPLLYCC